MSTLTKIQQEKAAAAFATAWQGKGYEKGDTQKFWLELLQKVFGVENPYSFIEFEGQVMVDSTNFMDVRIPTTRVLVEQKSIEKDLGKPVKQSDGSVLTPFQQAKKYIVGLPLSEHPRWVVACNFREFWVYDMEKPNGEPEKIALENLGKEYYRLQFLVDEGNENIKREEEISLKAGELVGKLYDAIYKEYIDPDESSLRSLNILCVRIVFCLYAEDAGLFETKTSFEDYIRTFSIDNVRKGIIDLFKALDTKTEDRDKYDLKLKPFPYVNGGLFKDEQIEIPNFTQEIVDVIVNHCAPFDWSEISPTIFGAVFESTLNPETRRKGGMHYTSVQNIHKVIDPLFMDDLNAEFEEICNTKTAKQKTEKLQELQNKMGRLTFMDPACGSGNFLTETYLSLRKLENKIISILNKGERVLGFDDFIKVHISQFYGIEINDFAVTVAKTALWIAESQMINKTEAIITQNIDFLPLSTNAYIVEGNALRIDWATLQPLEENAPIQDGLFSGFATATDGTKHYYDYIIGNPPFIGARLMEKEQKDDLLSIFGAKWKNLGNMDYVSGWFLKATQLMQANPQIQTALVATNSITQGEQVANLWKPLMEDMGVHINFAYRTFCWDSESSLKAHVHCVIIGFNIAKNIFPKHSGDHVIQFNKDALKSVPNDDGFALSTNVGEEGEPVSKLSATAQKPLFIFDGELQIPATNINAYLSDAPNVFVESRTKPLCDVPEMVFGNMPNDGGNFILTKDEKNDLETKEPLSLSYIKLFLGAEEFINKKERFCLWLLGAKPNDLRQCPTIIKKIEAVKDLRLNSKRGATQKLGNTPTLFGEIRQPQSGNYLLVPRVSSEKRKYTPMGFLSCDIIASDAVQIIPSATLYHFGILTSIVHMAWMRAVAGRLEMRYRYSKDIVYNNFPWPGAVAASTKVVEPIETTAHIGKLNEHKAKIEQTAQGILDARNLYPDSSLADLYDEVTMPPELRKAHQANDCAVMAAYGFNPKMTESEFVAELFKMYQALTKGK